MRSRVEKTKFDCTISYRRSKLFCFVTKFWNKNPASRFETARQWVGIAYVSCTEKKIKVGALCGSHFYFFFLHREKLVAVFSYCFWVFTSFFHSFCFVCFISLQFYIHLSLFFSFFFSLGSRAWPFIFNERNLSSFYCYLGGEGQNKQSPILERGRIGFRQKIVCKRLPVFFFFFEETELERVLVYLCAVSESISVNEYCLNVCLCEFSKLKTKCRFTSICFSGLLLICFGIVCVIFSQLFYVFLYFCFAWFKWCLFGSDSCSISSVSCFRLPSMCSVHIRIYYKYPVEAKKRENLPFFFLFAIFEPTIWSCVSFIFPHFYIDIC